MVRRVETVVISPVFTEFHRTGDSSRRRSRTVELYLELCRSTPGSCSDRCCALAGSVAAYLLTRVRRVETVVVISPMFTKSIERVTQVEKRRSRTVELCWNLYRSTLVLFRPLLCMVGSVAACNSVSSQGRDSSNNITSVHENL
jgi:hypothetical protein